MKISIPGIFLSSILIFIAVNVVSIYFISVVVINYIGFFCQMIWESIAVYYVEYKKKVVSTKGCI